jgi:septum formation protein
MRIHTPETVPIVLASDSPRRRRLVRALDAPVTAVSPLSEEGPPLPGETPAALVRRLSASKAEAVAPLAENAIVLGADTVVTLDGTVLGKPADEQDAARMLRLLRGRVHTVLTGLTAIDTRSGRRLTTVTGTDVRIRRFSDEELAAYVDSGAPMDKAGAYGIQDAGFSPASEADGCYHNVVGLPLCEVVRMLDQLGVRVRLDGGSGIADRCRPAPGRFGHGHGHGDVEP